MDTTLRTNYMMNSRAVQTTTFKRLECHFEFEYFLSTIIIEIQCPPKAKREGHR